MPTNRKQNKPVERWGRVSTQLRKEMPHLADWWEDTQEFSEIRVKSRPDGTFLAIAKGYGSDGGPMVAFGVGYDVYLSLMAIDSTIQGDNWKVDVPWDERVGKNGKK